MRCATALTKQHIIKSSVFLLEDFISDLALGQLQRKQIKFKALSVLNAIKINITGVVCALIDKELLNVLTKLSS
jgi:hypothetical protein